MFRTDPGFFFLHEDMNVIVVSPIDIFLEHINVIVALSMNVVCLC